MRTAFMNTLPYSGRSYLYMIILFLSYLLAAQVFSFIYTMVPTAPALIWPASGIALAGLILGGIALWPAILLASLTHQLLTGASLTVALGLGLANALQAFTGAWLLRRFGFTNSFSRVPHTLIFILVAVGASLIVPALGTLVLLAAEQPLPRGVAGTFMPWWMGQLLSLIVLTPLLVRWIPRFSFTRTRIELVEAWLSIASVFVVGVVLYFTTLREVAQIPVVYLILVPFLWIALRIGPRFMTLALFVNAVLALSGTAYLGMIAGADLGYELLQTQMFIIVLSLIFLLLVTVAEERKDTANDLRENVRRLEEAVTRIRKEDEAKTRFIATLAHELRNPLAPLMSSLEIMSLERLSDERAKELAGTMREHLGTMRHLLDDLLDISRISKEKLTLQKEHIDLQTVVNRAVRTVMPLIESREHTLGTKLPDEAIRLEADPVRLEQVFVNLLNNAAKYTEPGGSITLSAQVKDGCAVVSVKDTGIGMDAHKLEHVFEPFFQIEEPGKLHAGLGIGLSLTKNLVALHGGSIEALSAGLGKGSEILVRIPLAQAGSRKPAETGEAASVPVRALRILVVDDNRAAADALAKLLSLRGHETRTAYSGESAIAQAPEYRPDVILLDIGLPDMEGYDVARALNSHESVTATLVALTGYGQESDIRKAQKAGFTHHLTKPAGLSEIEAILVTIARD